MVCIMPTTPDQQPQNKKPKAKAAKPAVPKDAAKALAAIQSKLKTLAPTDLLPINLDIPRAVSIAVAAVPNLAPLRDAAATLPGFNTDHIDHIGTYALAAWHAHLLALPQITPNALTALLGEAKPLREHLLLAAELLAHTGYFDQAAVAAVRSGKGHLDTANDLVALSAMFTSAWPQVEHRSTILKEDIERAAKLGPELLIALGEREASAPPQAGTLDVSDQRRRAYTLFATAYDQCRRAAVYLRWNEGDADDLVPSLYQGRSRTSSSPPETTPAAPEAQTPNPTENP